MKYLVEIKRSVFEDENGNINHEYRQECLDSIGVFLREGKVGEVPKLALFFNMGDVRITPLTTEVKRKKTLRPHFYTYRHDNRRR